MRKESKILLKSLAPIIVGVVIALIPVPQGLSINAWLYFALFAAVITGVITEPIPSAAIGFIGVTIAAATGLVYTKPDDAIKWALSGFSNTIIWLIFAAFMFSLGYVKTGLGRRIALWLVRVLGKRTLGLGYAIATSDLALAPFTPSNTARSGGIIYPIIVNIPAIYGSHPGETARKIGSYVLYTAFAVQCVTSSMFLTGLAPNLLALSIVQKVANIQISWMTWFIGFLPAGVILFLLTPYLVYKLYPPEIKRSAEASIWASEQLKNMGGISRKEVSLLGLVILALALWIGGTSFIDPTTTALLVVCLMVILRIVNWNDVLGYKQAWNVLIWFATLVTMADGLAKVKFIDWVANIIASSLKGLSALYVLVLMVSVFFLLHYLFASLTAHATALLPIFLSIAIKLPGISPTVWALALSYTLGLMGIITPYATGPAPIYYGSGYIKSGEFWLYGLIFGIVFLVIYIVIDIPWLLSLGI